MALEKDASFEGQANGTTVTTSTVTQFDNVLGSTATHSTARSILGTSSLRVVSAAGSWVGRYDVTARARTRLRFYLWIVTPPDSVTIIAGVNATTTVRAAVRLNTNRTVDLRNATSTVDTSTALNAGEWHRIDWDANNGTGQTCRIYSGANLHTDTASQTISGAYNTGTHDRITLGPVSNITGELFFDCYATSNAGEYLSSAIWEVPVAINPSVAFTSLAEFPVSYTPYSASVTAHLNRLAGTTGLSATGAANIWAGTNGLSLVGALNAKNGTVGLGIQGVLNDLGGAITDGIGEAGAVGRIVS